jgi:dolichol-phosphate mannosyltransferase
MIALASQQSNRLSWESERKHFGNDLPSTAFFGEDGYREPVTVDVRLLLHAQNCDNCMIPDPQASHLERLSVIIPARNEEGCIASAVEHLDLELTLHNVPHEIIVVDDGSSDQTWSILQELKSRMPALAPTQNQGQHGFGRAVILGLDHMTGDAATIMMADESDDCRDVVLYWQKLNEGWDCVFGSRFMKGGGVIDYPWIKLRLNRFANKFLQLLFNIKLNDTTNAFKAYRKTVIDGCRPLIAPHFNLTVELPLKAIVRGYSWTVIPITWRNRKAGEAKFKIKEMGSRYLFICLYVWLEKYFSRGDYVKPDPSRDQTL